MKTTIRFVMIMTASTSFAVTANGQSARDIVGPSPLVPIANEPPPRLIVDPPLLGLTPGPHAVLFELADPTHRVLTSETVRFEVPARSVRPAPPAHP
jgi:hypothetical protein